MDGQTEYFGLRKALAILSESGMFGESVLDYLQHINWVTYKKTNFEHKELFFYNRKSDYSKFFENLLIEEEDLDYLINELESMLIIDFYSVPSSKRGYDRLGIILKTEHIFFMAENYIQEQREANLEIIRDLQELLDEAIIQENYEEASKIRDELNRISNETFN